VIVRSKLVLASAVAGLVTVPEPARAQVRWPVPVEDPQLFALIEEALSKNPDVTAARQAALAAAQRPAQARSLANPMVSVDYTNDGWSPSLGSMEMTTLAVTASQELPYPGKPLKRVNPSGFSGDSCSTGGCCRSMRAHGCGGMKEESIVF
jgi:outer membrane protein TolC